MEERRRSKRTEMSSTLMVKRLDQGDMQEVSIDIVDVSPLEKFFMFLLL